MTVDMKVSIIAEMKQLTSKYLSELKDILIKNDLVYETENKYLGSMPFRGSMPSIDNDMLENLFFELVEHDDCVASCLHDKAYVEQKIAEYEDYNSPKNRILRHMSEIERLKEKYNVSSEDLTK